MNKENVLVITDREELYDKCENMEQLFSEYYLPLLDVHYRKTYDLQQKINTYENPKDLTLMYMYCDEKAKDKIKELQNKIDKAIEYINKHIRIDDEYPAYMELLIEERDELLEILKGDDDE